MEDLIGVEGGDGCDAGGGGVLDAGLVGEVEREGAGLARAPDGDRNAEAQAARVLGPVGESGAGRALEELRAWPTQSLAAGRIAHQSQPRDGNS